MVSFMFGHARRVNMLTQRCTEIGILHTIATDAQGILDTAAPNRRPKPIASLFRAYDDVLPQHGIDPDEDRHLSAFLFKLGGEDGDESFVEKLQNILARMGIVLEFGEDESSASVKGAASPAPSEAHSTPSRPIIHRSPLRPLGRPGAAAPEPYFGRPNDRPSNYGFNSYDDDEDDEEEEEYRDDHEYLEEPQADPETEQAMQIARRAALSSALNKWRVTAAKAQRNQGAATLAASMSKLSLGGQRQGQETSKAPQARSQASTLAQRVPSASLVAPARSLERPGTSTGPSQADAARPPTAGVKTSLLPIFDRWRAAALERQQLEEPRQLSPVEERTQETTTRVVSPRKEQQATRPPAPPSKEEQKPSLSPQQDRQLRAQRTTSLREALENRVNAKQAHQKEVAQRASSSTGGTPPQQPPAGALRPTQTPQDQVALRAQEERDMQRAARARQIFLASRVFNHWADQTARRLEREAVARRHMIRFRCFKGWSQVTTSRAPAVDRLRVVTAAQKLKRACLENEEQLRVTAAAAAQSYRLKKVHAALDRWYYRLAEDVAQARLAHRNRLKTVTRWFLRAEDDADLGDAVASHRRQADGVDALIRWQGAAEQGVKRDNAAAQLGGRHLAWKYLRDWWDQAEAARRSKAYRQHSLAQKASHAFDIWNLQARAQAFVWHTQYRTVSRIFDYWLERSQEDTRLRGEVQRFHETTVKVRFVDQMREYHQQQSVLKRQADLSVLYIRSHRLLAVFDDASERREERNRQQVKQYLMRRYEEVSRARKKRNFFCALDCWRASAAQAQQTAIEAQNMKREHAERKVLTTVDKWSAQAEEGQHIDQRGQTDAIRGKFFQALNTWTESAADREHNQQAAQQHDSDRKKRQIQKIWANSTLRHSSHAHTAAALNNRYDRDKRNKAFNALLRWHAKDADVQPGTHTDTELASRTKRLSLGTTSLARNMSQENTSRRLLFGASQGTPSRPPISRQTPTPRKSRVDFASSNLLSTKRPTPILEEEGEGSRLLSEEEEEVRTKPPTQSPRGLGSLMAFPKLPSTTPRGPIPAHVEDGFVPNRSHSATGSQVQSFGNLYRSARQDRTVVTPSTNPTSGTGIGFSSRSTSGLPDRSMSGGSITTRSAGPYSQTMGTRGKPSEVSSYQPSKLSQRPLFGGSSAGTRGTHRPQLPDRLFPSPQREQDDDDDDLWDNLEEPDWEQEEQQ